MSNKIKLAPCIARQITKTTFQIISETTWPELSCMYFSIHEAEIVLIGLQPFFFWPNIFALIKEHGNEKKLSTIIVPEIFLETIDMLAALNEYNMQIKVIWNQAKYPFSLDTFTNLLFTNINDNAYHYTLHNNNVYQFFPSPFISRKDSFLTMDMAAGILFSNFLFDKGINLSNPFGDKTEIINYHIQNIPSSNFLQPVLNQIKKLNLEIALTRTGQIYNSLEIHEMLNYLSKLEFYNNFKADITIDNSSQNSIYLNLINQIITKLLSIFGNKEVFEVFENTTLPFNKTLLVMESENENNYRLWHSIFDLIYLKKGEEWLTVLEPVVNKIEAMHKVKKPNIYQSLVASSQQEIEALDKENKQLESELASLKDNLDKTTEKLLKDRLTGNYNEMFLKQFLLGEMKKFGPDRVNIKEISLIYLSVDNILGINAKYSKEIGDETLINIAYLLNQIKHENDLIFKRNGPGFIVYIGGGRNQNIYDIASKIQSTVAKADIFIESVTVSLALVQISEFLGLGNNEEIVDNLLSAGQNRIKLVHLKGANSLVDASVKTDVLLKANVLIVDDEDIQLKLLATFFNKANFDVHLAKDGNEALEISKSKTMDAIIVAKNIPKIDGLSLKSYLNESTFTMNTLYILTTYNKTPETIARANRLGIDFVMQKPLIFEELLGIIKRNKKRRNG